MVRAMTTLKPHLVRADTLDLQDHDAPSAKDHTRQPTHPSPYGYGPAAPHQARTLRQAEEQAYHQQQTNPRAPDEQDDGEFQTNQGYYDMREDDLDDEQSRHLHGPNGVAEHDHDHDQDHDHDPETDFDDGEGADGHDDDMDDDLMDKISSSPSIEDGKYSSFIRPPRVDSVNARAIPVSSLLPTRGSSSVVSCGISTSAHVLFPPNQKVNSASHLGEYGLERLRVVNTRSYGDIKGDRGPPKTDSTDNNSPVCSDLGTEHNTDLGDLIHYLLPLNDPLLEDTPDYTETENDNNDDEWVDEDENSQLSETSSEDDTEHVWFSADDRFIDSGWGGECLRDVEDIDFEFVYALHTFVATVEGQANATKGDTMVLLDDSNSYWWLVKVVKDGSIGYLPAEHIETPTERLARLNKHRNIDLSRTMLVDNAEKSKNPLKKAMRRRNAKSVAFTAPTYYPPSEYDWSDEEEMDDGQLEPSDDAAAQVEETDVAQDQNTSITAPLIHEPTTATINGIQTVRESDKAIDEEPSSPVRPAPEPSLTQVQPEDLVSRSRKGVVRNTDSFFKDDTAETKKISLTPRLLRGDSDSNGSLEQDSKQRTSSETFDKMLGNDEKPKDDRKKKEKKGMLSGLFKRKEKGGKAGKGESEEVEKSSEEIIRHSPQSKDSSESLTNRSERSPERRPSKLQKNPPTILSPKSSPTETRSPQRDFPSTNPNIIPPAPTGPAPAPPSSLRKIENEPTEPVLAPAPLQISNDPSPIQNTPSQTPNRFPSLTEKRSIFSPITTALKSNNNQPSNEPLAKPVYSKRAKERFAIDESESEGDSTPTAGPQSQPHRSVSPLQDAQDMHLPPGASMQVSPIEASDEFHSRFNSLPGSGLTIKPTETEVGSPQHNIEVTPIESEPSASTSKPSPSTATHTPSTSRSTPTWSDASLRTYMDNHQDIKDLLIIVHDKSNISPVGPEHPIMTNLYSNERTKLAEMQSQLDSMLMNWMSRKNTTLLSR